MELPNKLPCICNNPKCGCQFYANNPIGGSAGSHFSFFGNKTTCPKCGNTARYIDWSTDSQGNFHLHGFFNVVREIKDVEKLKNIKAELEAANDAVTATELADTLAELDPNFSKFRNLVKEIPPSETKFFITTLLQFIILVMMVLTWRSSQEQHDENIKILQDQQVFAKEQFDYQKQRDISDDKTKDEINEINKKISEIQSNFERKLKEIEMKNNKETIPPSRVSPCPCGSGMRYKQCCGKII